MKRLLRISLKIAAGLLGLLLLLFVITAVYISANKKKVTEMVMAELNKKISGNISIKEVEISLFAHFPKIGVALKDVVITDSLYKQHGQALLTAGELNARISAYQLIRKKNPLTGISLRDATIIMYTDSSGYSNTSIIRKKDNATGTDKGDNLFEKISVEHTKLLIDNRRKGKRHEFTINDLDVDTDNENDESVFKTNASIIIGQLGFNLRKGVYLHNVPFKADFDLRLKNNHLLFDSIDIRLDGHPFNLSGDFDLGKDSPQYRLAIHTKEVPYDKVLTFLPAKLAQSIGLIQVKKKLDASAFISGPLKGGEPLLNISWSAKNVELVSSFMDLHDVSFTGSYTNEATAGIARGDSNSRIVANAFTAKWHGLPVHIRRLEVLNLSNPVLTTDLSSSFPLTQLNELLQSNVLDLEAGNADVFLQYKGPIQRSADFNSLINGYIQFSNGRVLYNPRNVELNNVKGRMRFQQSDLFVDNLQANVFKTAVVMNGTARQLLSIINTNPNKAIIDWNIFMPSLDLNHLIFLLKQPSSVSGNKKGKQSIGGVSDKIDRLLQESMLNVSFHSNTVQYNKFHASNLQADVSLLQDRYNIQNASMNHAGGSMQLNGSLVQQKGNTNAATLNLNFNNVDISAVLTAFDNFGQDAITSTNIDGKLTAALKGSMLITDAGKVQPESINSDLTFSLKNGSLKNFEPIKKIQDYIFKKRDFDNISFAELKNNFHIHNREVTINRMEIQSSVLSMFVEGLYSMRGNTDISIQVPLSNLKKRKADYKPENIGVNGKAGSSIFLRGQPGSDGNIKFSLDLFKKYYKDNKK
ncbi:MAG: AsmA-like C-terminal region-containing protein [Ferruginibacter sp.]